MQMISFLYFALMVSTISVSAFTSDLEKHWRMYKQVFNKNYYQKEEEEKARRFIWEQNVNHIFVHNIEADLGLYSFKIGMNHLTDMTTEEANWMLNGYRRPRIAPNSTYTFIPPSYNTLPEEVDWRKEGLVTEVKDQFFCGSCWAFATIGALEGQHTKKTRVRLSLSEQNLVDCSFREGNQGCNGGLMEYGYDYIKRNRGINPEISYPYEGKERICRFRNDSIGSVVAGFADIPRGDEITLMKAVATVGPIAIAVDASKRSFQLYSNGVYDERECSQQYVNHAVLVVGYGRENGKDYWLVKNSWGKDWGENGYIKMSRNKNNQCGIASYASFPLL